MSPSVDRERARRLAVIGGSGFLGAWVVRVAEHDAGLAIASISRDPERFPRPHPGERVERIHADALQPGELERALVAWKPTHVVLCAALSRMNDCAVDPERAHRLNVDLPHRVAQFCRSGARLVHVSTDLVFGANAPPEGGFRESDKPAPISDYGRSKFGGEAVIGVHQRLDPRHLIVRLPLLHGPSFARGLGASDSLLDAVARGDRPLLFADERRTPLDVRDAAAALVELALSSEVGLLHVAGPTSVDRYAFGMAVLLEQGLSPAEARSKLRNGTRADAALEKERPADVSLDSTRARSLLRTRLRGPSEALADRAG